ncbi:hypothetical protein PSECIP111854_04144 [Pseudoalteromonas sp. CIP111854]|uniref:Uncharacterized protein n=1 Tax=Pseudoalteromonas holothuriae TaxID=2963714 RepID=A0A9W4R5K0_9GAMM|nr:hypothetical protein PSECIP111854_04144 [Pseudoalteromonas sp. CIP111854]
MAKESPILAGRLAANSSAGISTIARQIESVVSSDRAHHLQKPAYQIVRKSMRSRNEFLEDDGSRMLHSHECEIQALVDGVTSYTEQLQADGEISEINIDSGQILNCRNEESIIYLESSFEQPLKRGDSVKRTVSCIYNDSFLNDSEYWVIRPSNPTQDIEVQFIFPISRPPKKWGTIVRKLNYEEPSMYNAQKEILPDGRTTLLWQLPELGAQSSYKLTWEW